MIKAIADTMFLDETRNDGDFSKSLNWVLTKFKLNTQYKVLIFYLIHLAKYNRGIRTRETINAVKQFQYYLKSVEKFL
jgi:hypothetical protein